MCPDMSAMATTCCPGGPTTAVTDRASYGVPPGSSRQCHTSPPVRALRQSTPSEVPKITCSRRQRGGPAVVLGDVVVRTEVIDPHDRPGGEVGRIHVAALPGHIDHAVVKAVDAWSRDRRAGAHVVEPGPIGARRQRLEAPDLLAGGRVRSRRRSNPSWRNQRRSRPSPLRRSQRPSDPTDRTRCCTASNFQLTAQLASSIE